MIRVMVDLPYPMLASLEAKAGSHDISEEDRCAGWYGLGTDDEIWRNLMPHLDLRPAVEQDG